MSLPNNLVLPPVPPAGADAKWLQQLQATVAWNFNAGQTTATRPNNAVIGQHLFDITIGQPIWCRSVNPIVWVNGVGTVV